MNTLSYDQKSEIRLAFDEAFVEPERRRNARVRYQVPAEIAEYKRGKQGMTFTVQIEDFSPTGVGMVHSGRLKVGGQYTLEIPRPGQRPRGAGRPTKRERRIIDEVAEDL